ncbi:MAG TPA: ATP-binding cassette domain-containing protein [Candidatus Poseidoniales archaeon]|nr:phosphate ABC transporter ATP-binding protein [Euryarchaeota archaeon]DAC56034.1 MAG TPA: ATP-binding cassette domain-containing protein [Candidatus Poseidoniales archaeon]
MKRSSLWTHTERTELTDPLLILDKLVIGYNEPLTGPLSLEVSRGEVVAILGPSGAGKTTLLRTIAGLVMPLGGSSRQRVDKKGGLGYIPQNLGLARHATVAHNVSLGAGVRMKWSLSMYAERRKQTMEALEKVGMEHKATEPVRRLSGGQKRRVATARTLAQRPQLILADEFLSELDDRNASAVMDAVSPLLDEGSSLIMVEHHAKYALKYATRVWHFEDGKFSDLSVKEWIVYHNGGDEE